MQVNFDVEHIATTLCKMAFKEENTSEIIKALNDLKAIAENPYNMEYFRTLTNVLTTICNYDYLED